MLITDRPQYIADWVCAQRGVSAPPALAGIGFEYEGDLVAGVYFDAMTANNVFAHIASSASVMPKSMLMAVAYYVYEVLGIDRMTFAVPSNNLTLTKFVVGLGAVIEGSMKRAAGNCDMDLYVLWKDAPFPQRMLKLMES